MKTIADFKRRLKVGCYVHTIFHQYAVGRDENGKLILGDQDLGIRRVSVVQSNSFAFETVTSKGDLVDSWIAYPKKTDTKFIDENTITIFTPDFRVHDESVLIPCLTYKFL